jgi:DNA-binding MarR family transcriptional regulator
MQPTAVAERHRQIAEYIRQHDSVTPSELRSAFDLKTTTLNDDVRALEKEGTIKRMGRTRAVRYKTAVPDQNTTKVSTVPIQPTFPVVQPQSTSSSPPEQILDYLDEHSHASPAELKAALRKSSATVYRALCELIAAGFVERKGWGRASRYVLVEVGDDENIDAGEESPSEPTSLDNSPLSQEAPNKLKTPTQQAQPVEDIGDSDNSTPASEEPRPLSQNTPNKLKIPTQQAQPLEDIGDSDIPSQPRKNRGP